MKFSPKSKGVIVFLFLHGRILGVKEVLPIYHTGGKDCLDKMYSYLLRLIIVLGNLSVRMLETNAAESSSAAFCSLSNRKSGSSIVWENGASSPSTWIGGLNVAS